MAEKQFLDVEGLKTFSDAIKDGSLVAGKAASVDAANINGVLPLSKIPAAALERCHVVATEEARLALTAEDVQNGDTVKVTGSGEMYAVVDDTKLGGENAEEAFMVFAAGTSAKADEADSVPWSGVTGKPSKFPAETHTHTPAEAGIEPIPDSTIEAIISGTYSE